ncbi:MAG: iron-containing alcohol dehydrogenase [Desulfobacterales bacterium]
MNTLFEFQISTKIIYSRGSAGQIGALAKSLGMTKVQIVTDSGVANSGVMPDITGPLEKEGIGFVIFDAIEPNPRIETVDRAVQELTANKCDGVIAIGGGSPIDAAKCVAVLANNPGSAADYLGVDTVKADGLPCICVPTTAGTAAEMTDVAVLSDPDKKLKMGIRSRQIAPTLALLDPTLTLTLPSGPTRDSGLDALTHAIESFISVNAWRATDALTLKAIELVGRHLRTAVHNGGDIEARDAMLTASLMAGMGFHNTKLCLVHAITGPLGGIYDVPHGGSNAIVLPHAMEFLLPGTVEKYVAIARALGENVDGLSPRNAAEKAVSAVKQLAIDVDLPPGLSAYGVNADDFQEMSESIAGNFMIPLSPRIAGKDDILAILKAAL